MGIIELLVNSKEKIYIQGNDTIILIRKNVISNGLIFGVRGNKKQGYIVEWYEGGDENEAVKAFLESENSYVKPVEE